MNLFIIPHINTEDTMYKSILFLVFSLCCQRFVQPTATESRNQCQPCADGCRTVHSAYMLEPSKLKDLGKWEIYEEWGIFSQLRCGPSDPWPQHQEEVSAQLHSSATLPPIPTEWRALRVQCWHGCRKQKSPLLLQLSLHSYTKVLIQCGAQLMFSCWPSL